MTAERFYERQQEKRAQEIVSSMVAADISDGIEAAAVSRRL